MGLLNFKKEDYELTPTRKADYCFVEPSSEKFPHAVHVIQRPTAGPVRRGGDLITLGLK